MVDPDLQADCCGILLMRIDDCVFLASSAMSGVCVRSTWLIFRYSRGRRVEGDGRS